MVITMKKIILVLLVILSLFIFTVPTYAETCDDCKKTFCETCGQELPENKICETCGQEIKEENIETKPIEIHDLFNIDTPLKGFIFVFSIFSFLFVVCFFMSIFD